MKFTMKTITALAAAMALSSTSTTTNAFSIGSRPLTATGLRSVTRAAPLMAAPMDTTTATATSSSTDSEVQRLQTMAAKLRQEAAELEAQQAEERAQAVEKAFKRFDTNMDGKLDVEELKAALEKTFKLELSEDRVGRLMQDFDKDGDGKIQMEEFVGVDQFRNRLEQLASEERRKALEASKEAQKEEEVAKLMEAQLELINDKEPTATDKIVSVLPYLFPLMDGLVFGQHLLTGNENNPLVAALALLFVTYRSIPFSGFLAFFALSSFSGNLSINRLVRFNMQQSIFLDVALFVPGVITALTAAAQSGLNLNIPPQVGEMSGDALFIALVATLGYSAASSLLGKTPDKVPFISQAVKDRLPTADQFEIDYSPEGQPIMRRKDVLENDSNNEKKDN